MDVVFRTDASVAIGGGHVERCLTLARELDRRGSRCVFACRPALGDCIAAIERAGFKVVTPPDSGAADPAADSRALAEALAVMELSRADWLVVDHYELDEAFESAARGFFDRVAVVDDLANRLHDCDLLVDHNLGADAEEYALLTPKSAVVLAGPRFALLRPQFSASMRAPRERDGSIHRVLVAFGATDPTNETEKTLEAVALLGQSGLVVDVVLPEAAPHRASVLARCEGVDGVTVHGRVEDMAAFMTGADVMIGAGGVTLLERCATGLPSISLVVADNQARGTRAAAKAGATVSLGPAAGVSARVLANELGRLLADAAAVREMGLAALGLLGAELGTGPSTVAGLMECLADPHACSHLRALRPDDGARLRTWRNSDHVRMAMTNQHLVSEEEHRVWFERALAGTERCRFVYECGGVPLGFATLRDIDETTGTCEWGFYIGEPWAPKGSGARLGILVLDRAFGELGLSLVRAEVLVGNAASLAFHARMGFRETGIKTGSSPDGKTAMTWRLFEITAAEWSAVRPALTSDYFGRDGAS